MNIERANSLDIQNYREYQLTVDQNSTRQSIESAKNSQATAHF